MARDLAGPARGALAMRSMMRFLGDTQVEGRFFPKGALVQALPAGDMALVLPDPVAHTTLCAVPVRSLVPLQRFRIVLVNHRVGLMDEQFRWAIDADDVRAAIDHTAPDCEIVAVHLAEMWTG
jgi:hypothetical protein